MKKIKLDTAEIVLAALFIVLYVVSARLSLSILAIPFSLQTMFLLMAAMVLKARVSFVSVCVYVLMGIVGLPVFTGGGGFAYLQTIRGAYLPGFIFMVLTVGLILKVWDRKNESNRKVSREINYVASSKISSIVFKVKKYIKKHIKYIVVGIIGVIVQYIFTVSYYMLVINLVLKIPEAYSLEKTANILFVPYIIPDIIKAVIAAVIAVQVKAVIRRRY